MEHFLYFMLGACLGSFFGVLIVRFPEQSLITPASHCDHCQTTLGIRDLIPLFSQVFNRFRCRFCKAKVPIWYWVVEWVCGLFFWATSQGYLSISELLLLYSGLILSIYDMRSQSYPVWVWGIFFALSSLLSPWSSTTLICLLLAILAQLGALKMGAGDFLYLASISLVASLHSLLWILQVACVLAIAYIIGRKINTAIPFVPFLYLGQLLLLLGESLPVIL